MRNMSSPSYVKDAEARIHEENIQPVTLLCQELQDGVPGSRVPLVDPVHDVDDARIISLQIAPGPGTSSGFLSLENDDPTAARLAEVYEAAGLQPRHGILWNAYPWELPAEAGMKLTLAQTKQGVRPFRRFLAEVPRVSAIVAHGGYAQNLIDELSKTGGDLILRERGIKVYKVRSTGDRSFIGNGTQQEGWFVDMVDAYTDAMGRAGLPRPAK
ncbi:hypothetical protein GCM10023081_14990 [Arthrobacter ginkgonis]|uniref:Uracil-DNA glycosylase n=2 Tax=Arthrobacter ginkgonis TaxID=1630594 RepID=A0ABP7C2J4_9MICC